MYREKAIRTTILHNITYSSYLWVMELLLTLFFSLFFLCFLIFTTFIIITCFFLCYKKDTTRNAMDNQKEKNEMFLLLS